MSCAAWLGTLAKDSKGVKKGQTYKAGIRYGLLPLLWLQGTSVCLLVTALGEELPSFSRRSLRVSYKHCKEDAAVTSVCTHSSVVCKHPYLDSIGQLCHSS